MPTKKKRRTESLKQIILRFHVSAETVNAALQLVSIIIALAQVVKVPLEVEKVVPVQIDKVKSE